MKVALISDIHFGCRNDSDLFLDSAEHFFKYTFFPKIDELNIKTVINLGDTFDRRKFINFKTLKRTKEIFFDPLVNRDILCPTIIGNHDTYHKNNNDTNSIELLLNEYQYYNLNNDKHEWIDIINKPTIYSLHGYKICMIPWINPENETECFKVIEEANCQFCMGHFTINGFVMQAGHVEEGGLDRNIFNKFNMVLSGHFHHRSTDGHIYYLGNPYEMTWQDYNDPKGFHILDLDTKRLDFVPNPFKMFHRLVYDDTSMLLMTSQLNNAYVKIVVQKKTRPELFEKFMEEVYKQDPFCVNIVSNFIDVIEADVETIDQSDDTVTLMMKYVSRLYDANPIFDLNAINKLLIETYQKALNDDV